MIAKPTKFLIDRPIAAKIARNVFWLALERFSRLFIALVVAIVLARFLGPEEFGVLNLALAFVSVFGTLAAFGLNAVVPKELVKNPAKSREILGSSFLINLVAAICAYCALVLSAYGLNPQNQLVTYLVAIIGTSIIFKSTQVINYWFESQVDSKRIVWAENFAIFIVALLKLLLAWLQAPLVAFATAIAIEALIIAIAVINVYRLSNGSPLDWTASFSRMKRLVSQSWPLLVSSAAWILYTRVDQIMIGRMVGNEAVGHYSAATRLSDATNILPGLVVVSIVPAITLLRESDSNLYRQKFQVAYDLVFGLSVVLAVVLSLSSSLVIDLAYGQEYAESAVVLAIHAWAILFVSMAVVSGRYLINEGKQKLTMIRHLLGVIVNVALNYWLIGSYGIKGAALATLISLIVVNYLIDALHPDTRACFVQKTKSIVMAEALRDLSQRLRRA